MTFSKLDDPKYTTPKDKIIPKPHEDPDNKYISAGK